MIAPGAKRVVVQTPPPEAEVIPGVRWGNINAPMTPAFWKASAAMLPETGPNALRAGDSLVDEMAVCLLSGFGIKAELAYAAYRRLRDRGLLAGKPEVAALEAALREPLQLGARAARYRFPTQKAKYLAGALEVFRSQVPPVGDLELRAWLMGIEGIGAKTASFIVRNWLLSDQVAILDVHVIRAGTHMGLFRPSDRVESMYDRMERRFLDFARAINVRASILDLMIWGQMREYRFAEALGSMDEALAA